MWRKIVEIATTHILGTTYNEADDTLIFESESGTTIYENTIFGCAKALEIIIRNIGIDPYVALKLNDTEITSYININDAGSGVADLDTLDKHLTYSKALLKNRIRVYDITRGQYEKYDRHNCVTSVIKNQDLE